MLSGMLLVEVRVGTRDLRHQLGQWGEDQAALYLEKQGYRILDRNWRCRIGEIDIVAQRGSCLAITEVKTRSSVTCGQPYEAVTPAKVARLRRLAAAWCADRSPGAAEVGIDVISITRTRDGLVTLEHLEGVES